MTMKKKVTYEMSGISFEKNNLDDLIHRHQREDYLIESDVKKILLNNVDYSRSKILFNVFDGVITLSGEVSTFRIRMNLHHELLKIDGVVDVKDHISVSPES